MIGARSTVYDLITDHRPSSYAYGLLQCRTRPRILSVASGKIIVDFRNITVNTDISDRLFTVETLKSGKVP